MFPRSQEKSTPNAMRPHPRHPAHPAPGAKKPPRWAAGDCSWHALAGALADVHHLAGFAALKVVGPPLQQLGALGHVSAAVVGGAHFVAFLVCKLALDHIRPPAGFVGHGREQRPEAVGRGQILVAHAGHGGVEGVLTQRFAGVEGAGEDQLAVAAEFLHGLQQLQGLA